MSENLTQNVVNEQANSDIILQVKNLKKVYGDHVFLKDICIDIKKGEKVVVVGPSGSGKSTFLRCLNCMEDPSGGQIIFDGTDIADD